MCKYLDSTFLGTILEMCALAERAGADLRIQGAGPQVRELFEELEMPPVLKRLAKQALPLPERMTPLTAPAMNVRRDRERILRAHEALAALSDRGRAEFAKLIECVRAEMEDARPEH